jgi:hypothetical protein
MRTRSYRELRRLRTFEERYDYLALHAQVGVATFGFDRWINQAFYRSREWKSIRSFVITRDLGCDLGVEGFEIHEKVYIHHMNPMVVEDLTHGAEEVLDPEFLISTTHRTHNAIHYGDRNLLPKQYNPRTPNDTKLW